MCVCLVCACVPASVCACVVCVSVRACVHTSCVCADEDILADERCVGVYVCVCVCVCVCGSGGGTGQVAALFTNLGVGSPPPSLLICIQGRWKTYRPEIFNDSFLIKSNSFKGLKGLMKGLHTAADGLMIRSHEQTTINVLFSVP